MTRRRQWRSRVTAHSRAQLLHRRVADAHAVASGVREGDAAVQQLRARGLPPASAIGGDVS